ncbi:MAG TPA: FAD-dependent oxidoreductase [Actinomycetota bacterium]|nr:FAD-dependent oxidoreductase [Actinomycetota bacterium]
MVNRRIRRNLRTPGARATRRLVAAIDESARSGVPVEEVLGTWRQRDEAETRRRELLREERAERATGSLSRRQFLSGAAAAGAVVALGPLARAPAAGAATGSRTAPRIVIVGAGLAGVRCAHDLWTKSGARGAVASTVYEADTTHVGGRCWSLRGYFTDGLIGEHGGAFINSDQRATRKLADELGLEQERVYGGGLPGLKDIYWFDGRPYTYHDASEDWKSFGYQAFQDAFRHAPYPQLYDQQTPGGVRIDLQSVPEWLDRIGIGADSRFGRLMQANSVSEYGGSPGEQSALNLLYLLAWNRRDQLDPLPGYDEMFHVVGGNDQLVSRMVGQLPDGTVRQGYELVALRRKGTAYRLTFHRDGGGSVDVDADHVVLALPFTKLREVDLSGAGFSPLKMNAIRHLPLGQNAKIHVQVEHKTWPQLGYDGSAYTDWKRFCVCWDDSVPLGPDGAPAILLGFPGGSTGEAVLTGQAHGPAPAGDVSWFLDQIEPIFPGTTAAYSGIAWEDHWAVDPWHLGAYSYWKVGQTTSFAGYEGVQEGNVHFAGEHTEWDDQGFLDGAVVSGERVAKEIRSQT